MHIKYALCSSMLAIHTYVLDNYPEGLKLFVFIHTADSTEKKINIIFHTLKSFAVKHSFTDLGKKLVT